MNNKNPTNGFSKFSEEGEADVFNIPPNKNDVLETVKTSVTQEFKPVTYRFVILGLYLLSAFTGAAIVYCFSPIVKTLSNVFHASTWEVYALTHLYLYSGSILNFPLLILLQKLGNKNSISIGLALLLIGSFIKLFMISGIVYAILGQIFCVVGYEFLHPIIGAINCYWFPASSRVTIFAISDVAYSLGTMGGFLIPTLFITEDHPLIEANMKEVFHLKIFFCVLTTLVLLLHLIFFMEKPKFPLSQASLISRYDFLPSLKSLINNKNFLMVMVGMALLISVNFARFNNYYFLAKPFGFDQSQAAYLAVLENWGEFLGLIIIMFISTRVDRPKLILNWIPLGIAILLGVAVGIHSFNNFIASAIISFFLGMIFSSFRPLCENYSVAVTFPVPENIAVGTIFTGGLWGAWINGLIATSLRDNFTEETFIWVIFPYFFVLIFVAGIILVKMKDDNLREEHEKPN